jgi:VanZ family protein
MSKILLVIIFLIIYGSLYPFQFTFISPTDLLLDKLTHFNPFSSSLADLLANTLLFIPYGLLLAFILQDKVTNKNNFIITVITGFVLAYLIQVIQLWTVERVPSGSDSAWNLLGAIIGYLIAFSFPQKKQLLNRSVDSEKLLPFTLALFILLFHLWPFVPTFDWGFIKNNLKTLLIASEFELLKVFEKAVFWFTPFFILNYLNGDNLKFRHLVYLTIVISILQLFILDSLTGINNVIGAILALFSWKVFGKKVTKSHLIILLSFYYFFFAFYPFEFRGYLGSFNWLPFEGSLTGSMIVNLSAIIEKVIIYGTLLWLFLSCNYNLKKTTFGLALVAFIVEYLQVFFAYKTPDITDSIIILLIGYSLFQVEKHTSKVLAKPLDGADEIPQSLDEMEEDEQENITEYYKKPFMKNNFSLTQYLPALIILLVMTIAQYAVFSLPNLPYNLRELYLHDGTVMDFFFLSFAMLFFIVGLVGISQKFTQPNSNILKAPLYCALVCMVTLLLLKMSVTAESIADINGSSNITYQLTGLKILGEPGASFVQIFGMESFRAFSQIVEPFIRFAALLGPITYFIVICLISYERIKTGFSVKFQVKLFASFLPWFFMSKLISFDYSSTDNLNELIARDGTYGLGGGGYLYALVFVIICISSRLAWLVHNKQAVQTIFVVVLSVVSLPLTWYLLNSGLVSEFTKYDSTYSGVDFFLGPDRKTLISNEALFLRWSGVHTALIGVLFIGILIGLKILSHGVKSFAAEETKRAPNTHHVNLVSFFNKKIMIYAASIIFIVFFMLAKSFVGSTIQTVEWAGEDANIILDHHTHTKMSDGKLSVAELVTLANDNGCDAIAITDHTDAQLSLSDKKLSELALARKAYPNMLIFGGAELEMPSYKGREHVSLLLTPEIEKSVLSKIKTRMNRSNRGDLTDDLLLNTITSEKINIYDAVAIYNHPSRKDNTAKENVRDYLKWQNKSDLLIGFSGAPGHQKSQNIGSYNTKFKTIERWDPVVAELNNAWDILLSHGHQTWGAIASSDYHTNAMDEAPCSFARIHVASEEKSYQGVLKALQAGTFWSDHGRILQKYKLSAELEDAEQQVYSGSVISSVDKDDIAVINFDLQRDIGSVGFPLTIEVISNCQTGEAEIIDQKQLNAFENKYSSLVQLLETGKDNESCYVRSRVRVKTSSNEILMAYSNHIRFRF